MKTTPSANEEREISASKMKHSNYSRYAGRALNYDSAIALRGKQCCPLTHEETLLHLAAFQIASVKITRFHTQIYSLTT